MRLILHSPLRHARCCQWFRVATLLDKISLQRGDLQVQQIICLVHQADQRVGNHRRISFVQPMSIRFPVGDRIRPIRLMMVFGKCSSLLGSSAPVDWLSIGAAEFKHVQLTESKADILNQSSRNRVDNRMFQCPQQPATEFSETGLRQRPDAY